MILRPRRHSEISREISDDDDTSEVTNFQKTKNVEKNSTMNESSFTLKLSMSRRPRSSKKCSSQSSTVCSISFESDSKCEKSSERFSLSDLSLTNPIVLMDRYKPPKDDSIDNESSNDTASCPQEILDLHPKSTEDSIKESITPKTPDTATASDSSTPPRKMKKDQSEEHQEFSDDDVSNNESRRNSLEDQQNWKPKPKICLKKADQSKDQSFASTEVVKKKKKLVHRQATKRSHSTTDRECDVVATKPQILKKSPALFARSHDSGDGPRKKTKRSKLEEEREVDYYASLLWISDNMSEYRKQHQTWSDEELESSLRLKWNSLKKKEKSEHLARIQRISYLPKLGKINPTNRMRQWKGDGRNQTFNFEMLAEPGKSLPMNPGFRNEQTDNEIRTNLSNHLHYDEFQRMVPHIYGKRKEFNLKTLFRSPGAIKKQIIKLIRDRIACTHCFLNLKQFLVSKLDESWEKNISKTNRPEDVPHLPSTQGRVTPHPFPSMGGAVQKDNFEPALIQVASSGRIVGVTEEKRRLKKLWSGRVWKIIEDLVQMMEQEIYKRGDCQCRFKMNSNVQLFFETKNENLKFNRNVSQQVNPTIHGHLQIQETKGDDSVEDSEEARVAIEILEQWTKKGSDGRQNSSEFLEISVADERVIKEIKVSLMEYGEMVVKDSRLVHDDPICREITRLLKSQNIRLDNDESSIKEESLHSKVINDDSWNDRNHNASTFDGRCYVNSDGVVMMSTNPLNPSGRCDVICDEEMMEEEWKMRMFHPSRFNHNCNLSHHNHSAYHHHHQQYYYHHYHHHHLQRPRYPMQLNRGMTSKSFRNSANNLFLDSYFGPGQRSHFVLPSAINSRPSPAFLTIKPPPLPPMPPLPPTPPPSTGSGLYHVDNELLRACQESEACCIHSLDASAAADDVIKRRVLREADIKQNQFFLKLSVKNSKNSK